MTDKEWIENWPLIRKSVNDKDRRQNRTLSESRTAKASYNLDLSSESSSLS
jgi:hypothetical protein